MAAVLASGPETVLSHRSAAALWGLIRSERMAVEVSAPRALRPVKGIQRHRIAVAPDERTTRAGIPVTSPFRTLLDLAAVVTPRQLERALSEATVQRLTEAVPMARLLDRHRHRPGAARLKAVLDRAQAGTTLTRRELEERFLAFVDAHGLPRPAINATIRLEDFFVEADAAWRERRLVVELDSYGFHAHREAFERDRERDRALQVAGWRVVRLTWRQLHENGAAVDGELRSLLGLP